VLCEMKPVRISPAHTSADFAELVCSNSLRSNVLENAVGLLKQEMRRLGSLVMTCADENAVPAGRALAVDRAAFAKRVTEAIESEPRIEVRRGLVERIPEGRLVILATGPLTAPELARDIQRVLGDDSLYFYDAISPIVYADSIDHAVAFRASRWQEGEGDYLNLPLDRAGYERFVDDLLGAETVPLHPFEAALYFEGCLPIEEMARRGRDTLAFGPMKPVGLVDPRSGTRPYAVVQLRQEDKRGILQGLVGFQTRLRQSDQKRVFRMIPGLEGAEFVRHGMIHRNTYVNAPLTLEPSFETRRRRGLFFAGQMSGVEGYVESAGSGLVAGLGAFFRSLDREPLPFPEDTALGALGRYIARSDPAGYQPTNVAFGLLPELPQPVPDRARRRRALAQRALLSLERFRARLRLEGGLQAEAAASTG